MIVLKVRKAKYKPIILPTPFMIYLLGHKPHNIPTLGKKHMGSELRAKNRLLEMSVIQAMI